MDRRVGEVVAVGCAGDEASNLVPLLRSGLADDDGGRAVSLVEHSSDGVVHRGGGIEGAAGGVGEPAPETGEEAGYPVRWVPLA